MSKPTLAKFNFKIHTFALTHTVGIEVLPISCVRAHVWVSNWNIWRKTVLPQCFSGPKCQNFINAQIGQILPFDNGNCKYFASSYSTVRPLVVASLRNVVRSAYHEIEYFNESNNVCTQWVKPAAQLDAFIVLLTQSAVALNARFWLIWAHMRAKTTRVCVCVVRQKTETFRLFGKNYSQFTTRVCLWQ